MGALRLIIQCAAGSSADPLRELLSGGGRKRVRGAKTRGAPHAQRSPGAVREPDRVAGRERSPARRARFEFRREAEGSHDTPRSGERQPRRGARLGSGKIVEATCKRVEQLFVSLVRGEAEHELTQCVRPSEPLPPFGERCAHAQYVKTDDCVEVVRCMEHHLGGTLCKQIQRGPKTVARAPRSARNDRPHSRVTSGESKNARGFAVVERVEHDGFGNDPVHLCKLFGQPPRSGWTRSAWTRSAGASSVAHAQPGTLSRARSAEHAQPSAGSQSPTRSPTNSVRPGDRKPSIC
jgi:hypothetical protein